MPAPPICPYLWPCWKHLMKTDKVEKPSFTSAFIGVRASPKKENKLSLSLSPTDTHIQCILSNTCPQHCEEQLGRLIQRRRWGEEGVVGWRCRESGRSSWETPQPALSPHSFALWVWIDIQETGLPIKVLCIMDFSLVFVISAVVFILEQQGKWLSSFLYI